MANLHPSWDPNNEAADDHYRDIDSYCNKNVVAVLAVNINNSDAIDDNLEKKHDLEAPAGHYAALVQ